MDFEALIFNLNPLLDTDTVVSVDPTSLDHYLAALDSLAVGLRSPNNRDLVGQSGLLLKLVLATESILSRCFECKRLERSNEGDDNDNAVWLYFKLASELVRCLANALVDNDDNRKIFLNADGSEVSALVTIYTGKILQLSELDRHADPHVGSLQMRVIVLIKNLCLENSVYTERVGRFVRGSLLAYLRRIENDLSVRSLMETFTLGVELLNDFVDVNPMGLKGKDIEFMAKVVEHISTDVVSVEQQDTNGELDREREGKEQEEEEEDKEDPISDTLFNLTQALESSVTRDDKLDLSTANVTLLHQYVFKALDTLFLKSFPNKLIVMRRLSSVSGYISFNPTVSNQQERKLCIEQLKISHNGYVLGAALLVLSNSINSRQDADLILGQVSLEQIIGVTQYLSDPVQSQGLLDILKKLLNMSNAMFLSRETLTTLSTYLIKCSEQCKYFQNLSPLLVALLKKLITVLPSNLVRQLCKTEFLALVVSSGTVVSALTLDKLLVSSQTDIMNEGMEKLWDSVFRWREELGGNSVTSNTNVSGDTSSTDASTTLTLFQISKTIGIYLRNCDTKKIEGNILFSKYSSDLYDVMEAIWLMREATDKGSMSVFNNGKFIAGMVRSLLEGGMGDTLTADSKEQLDNLSRQFLLS